MYSKKINIIEGYKIEEVSRQIIAYCYNIAEFIVNIY